MIINMNGGSGGSSSVNFKVICSANTPTSPKENNIWIKTSTATNSWSMIDSIAVPSSVAEGDVVIVYEASNRSKSGFFNALKKNELIVKLVKCYQRVSSKWVSMDAYVYLNSKWIQFSNVFKATITVTYPAGSNCSVTNGSITIKAPDTSGSVVFTIPDIGTWTVTCTDGSQTATSIISITADGQSKSATLAYNKIPTFTYTGDYKILNDSGEEITVTKENDWNIKFLSSGTLTIKALNGLGAGGQVFLVGGGAGGSKGVHSSNANDTFWGSGGGGGGYTKTSSISSFPLNTSIAVTVGGGGAAGANGGTSSIVVSSTTYSADGGKASSNSDGGAGGSGGAAGSWGQVVSKNGGTNGGNGEDYKNPTYSMNASGGIGQGTTTRAFGASSGYAYSEGGGGGGGRNWNSSATGAAPGDGGNRGDNTGDGGKGYSDANSNYPAKAGCSGVIILRGKR